MFVLDQSNTSVRVFDRATLTQIRSFAGGNTELSLPGGIAIDAAAGEIYIANVGSNTVTVHAIGSSGNVEVSVRDGSALVRFDAGTGTKVILRRSTR